MPPLGEPRQDDIDVPVWDLPVRLGHWILVLLLAASWFTGKYGALIWHRRSGYAILILVLFRIYWGFAGSSTARFLQFLRGPRAVWNHSKTLLERSSSKTAGHTALGGWSIVAMLLLLLVQSGLGLLAVDVDGIESGPLSDLVSFETGRYLASWHGRVMDILLIVIVLHLTAILYYWIYKRDNLISAMLTGAKRLPPGIGPAMFVATFWRAVVGLAAAGLVVTALITRMKF